MMRIGNGDACACKGAIKTLISGAIFGAAVMEEQLGEEMLETTGEREIWRLGIGDERENLLSVNVVNTSSADHTNSTLYTDHFSPCMSSSSSSSTPALTKPPVASSSSAIYFKSDDADFDATKTTHHHTPQEAWSSTASVEGFQQSDSTGMHLVDGNDLWDPSSIFSTDDDQNTRHYQGDQENNYLLQENSEGVQECYHEKRRPEGFDELGVMFLEWLKTNKHHISAHDLRSIKLNRSTIESASKRLGTTKEGRKQLLKLVLEWVEQYQLQKKHNPEQTPAAMFPCQYEHPFPNPNPHHLNSIPTDRPNPCLIPPVTMMAAPPTPVFQPVGGYNTGADSHNSGGVFVPAMNCQPYPPPTEFQMPDSAESWPPSQCALASHYNSLPENGNFVPFTPQPMPQSIAVYGDHQYPYPVFNNGTGRLVMRQGSAASKEARKKRMMAQKRRFSVHHRRHHPTSNQNKHHNDTTELQNATKNIGVQNCTNNAQGSPANYWVYWPPAATVPAVVMLAQPPIPRPQPQSYQCQAQSERRQGNKAENNLKFLMQKVLKQSDVGSLGRIVLPKKEAERHLPELEERDGMPIAIEDIGTSRVWNMRYRNFLQMDFERKKLSAGIFCKKYRRDEVRVAQEFHKPITIRKFLRFWSNNNSRMYLLENTGEFVRANGLLEGDFIVIYSDIKCGKYLIRGVKVHQPAPKADRWKAVRRRNSRNSALVAAAGNNGNSPSPSKQTVR